MQLYGASYTTYVCPLPNDSSFPITSAASLTALGAGSATFYDCQKNWFDTYSSCGAPASSGGSGNYYVSIPLLAGRTNDDFHFVKVTGVYAFTSVLYGFWVY